MLVTQPPSPPDFKALQIEWRIKLEESGFVDQEDAKGNLKNFDRRTIAFDNRELIQEFFTWLEHALTHGRVPECDRPILELYAQGIHQTEMAKRLNLSRSTLFKVIDRYKKAFSTGV